MSSNISKEKREKLIAEINEIKHFIEAATPDANTKYLLSYISNIEKELKAKKYGLVFEEHKENIDEILETHLPYLKEEKDLFIDNGGEMNFLIEGDNLASLQLLEKTHKGAIDLIYIDPPYNTGNKDFIYDDNFVDKSDQFIHSKWLSFMSNRLIIAKKLLTKTGCILIHIDENEIGSLLLLAQSLFGDNNVDTIIWPKTDPKVDRNTNAKIIHRYSNFHEYIVILYNNKHDTYFNKIKRKPEWKNSYTNPDKDPRGPYKQGIISFTEGHKKEDKTSPLYYSIKTPTGKIITRLFFFPKEEYLKYEQDNRIYYPSNGDGVPALKIFENEEKEFFLNSIVSGFGTSSTAKDEIFEIFGDRNKFDTPKPTKLGMELVRMVTNKKSTILDFFAGSGTTGHAVMKLNAEDGGNRKFILCTNNENNICRDITYERIKRVINKENYQASVKYMKVGYLPIDNKLYYEYADELLKHIKELVELENAINFDNNQSIAIMLTEEELDKFTKNIPAECKSIYLGHNVLPTQEQEDLFRTNDIKINIIPDYYYKELEN